MNNCYKPTQLFFTNLSNPLKLAIVSSLEEGDKNVTELSIDLGVEQSKLSHALASLKRCKIVESKISGKERVYSLNKKLIFPFLKLMNQFEEEFCKHCELLEKENSIVEIK